MFFLFVSVAKLILTVFFRFVCVEILSDSVSSVYFGGKTCTDSVFLFDVLALLFLFVQFVLVTKLTVFVLIGWVSNLS